MYCTPFTSFSESPLLLLRLPGQDTSFLTQRSSKSLGMGIGDMECPVFRPTLEDIYGPFERYIEKIEKKMAVTGICKIVPPESWVPRRGGYPDNLDLTIERPIRQHATGSRGLYRALYIEQKPLNLASEFRPQALEKDNMPSTSDAVELERKYWKNITLRPPLYGADVPGSLFDEKAKVCVHARGGGAWHLPLQARGVQLRQHAGTLEAMPKRACRAPLPLHGCMPHARKACACIPCVRMAPAASWHAMPSQPPFPLPACQPACQLKLAGRPAVCVCV